MVLRCRKVRVIQTCRVGTARRATADGDGKCPSRKDSRSSRHLGLRLQTDERGSGRAIAPTGADPAEELGEVDV
jgi:hypothetical protein